MRKPFVIGLTGGIGSGKSVVLADLVSLGAEGIDADRVAHEVMAPDGPAYAPIVAEFGRDILAPDGQIDRGRLGQRVFADRRDSPGWRRSSIRRWVRRLRRA